MKDEFQVGGSRSIAIMAPLRESIARGRGDYNMSSGESPAVDRPDVLEDELPPVGLPHVHVETDHPETLFEEPVGPSSIAAKEVHAERFHVCGGRGDKRDAWLQLVPRLFPLILSSAFACLESS